METFTSLSDIWNYYDKCKKKKFSSHDITMAINSLPKDNSEAKLCGFEAMAFSFSENNYGKAWGTYYGPQFIFKKKDTGEEVYSPDIRDVTIEMIEYWENRFSNSVNPLLKTRYSGLVLEFKKRVTSIEPNFKKIKIGHIRSLLDVVSGDYCKYETAAFDYANRALELAIRFNNRELQKDAVKIYFEAHQRLSKDDMLPGIWGRIFLSLINHRKYFNEYEERLLNEQMERFKRLKSLALTEGNNTDGYAHVLSDQVNLLADYYHLIGENQKIEPYLDSLLEAIKLSIPVRGGMWGQGMIQQMQHRYRKYGFDRKANQLFVELQGLGDATLDEMQTMEYSIPLDKGMIQAYLDDALQGTDYDVIMRYMIQYLPRMEDERRKLKEKAVRSPLLDIVSTVTIDSSGNPISRVGVGPDADHQKLYFSMYENMRFAIPLMHLHVTTMKEKGKLTTESMMDMLKDSPLISDNHREIVRRGFEAYMKEDYLVCCHLLVPQLEAAIRRLFAYNGANIMRNKANPIEGNEYLSLDSLLESDYAIEFMGEDLANYLRNVLTNQYGWNIRNQVSHGLLGSDNFNHGMADRLVHAFLMLAGFKVEK